MSQYTDTFIRGNQSGWGISSDGNSYVSYFGSPVLDIVSNQGRISTTAYNACAVIINNIQSQAIDSTISFINNQGRMGIMWRATNSAHYEASIENSTSNLFLNVTINGITSQVVTPVFVSSYIAGSQTSMRVMSNTTDISVYVWPFGTQQPSTPTISINDSSIQNQGYFGAFMLAVNTNNNFFTSFATTYNSNSSVSPLPTGWQQSIINMSSCIGSPFDILNIDPRTYSSTLNSLSRGLLSISSDSLRANIINKAINGNSYLAFSRHLGVVATTPYAMSVFNPSNSGRYFVIYSVVALVNYSLTSSNMILYRCNADTGYDTSVVEKNNYLYGSVSPMSLKTNSTTVAFLASTDIMEEQNGVIENNNPLVLPPGTGIIMMSNTALTQDIIHMCRYFSL